MRDLILLVAGAVVGLLFGLIGAVYVEDRWKDRKEVRRRLRWANRIRRSALLPEGGAIMIAGNPTRVHLVEGDGQIVLEPAHISIDVRSQEVELPPAIISARRRIRRELAASARKSGQKVSSWNSSNMIALRDYHISRTRDREEPTLHLEVSLNDYATFAATVLRLDEEYEIQDGGGGTVLTTLRRQYFPNSNAEADSVRHPIPFLANGLGVMLLAFTDDNKVVLSKRRQESRARPGERDVSVVEGIDANADRDGERVDVYRTAIRGCREELGVDEVSREDISFLAFAVDMDYYQWNLLGLVRLRRTSSQLVHEHLIHAKDRWESNLEAIDVDPIRIFEILKRDHIWDIGLVTTYLALCRRLGPIPVREATEKVFGFPLRKAPWRR